MTTTLDTPASRTTRRTRVPMDPVRRSAFLGGAAYLITFATSIPAVFILRPVLNDPGYILGTGADTQVTFGTMLDLVNALAAIASAVALFPVVRRHSETLALGFVTTRLFEAAVIVIGVVSLLTVVSLRQPGASGGEADALMVAGQSLVATYDWTFLLGPNVMASLNALVLGTLLYRSGLVPRILPAMGLVGAPMLLAVTIATIFGLTEHGTVWWVVAAPIFVWELSLGLYLVLKGFKPCPVTDGLVATPTAHRHTDA